MPSERIQRQIESLLDEAESAVKQLHWLIVRNRGSGVYFAICDLIWETIENLAKLTAWRNLRAPAD